MRIIISTLIIGLLLISCGIYTVGVTTGENKNSEKMHELETELDTIKLSKEYKAILACKDSNYWKKECLEWELNK